MTLDEARAALARGRPVIVIAPPDPGQAGALWPLLADAGTSRLAVIVCADPAGAAEWSTVVPPGLRLYAVSSLGRGARHLPQRTVDVIAGGADDLIGLAAQSVLKLDAVATIVLAWPEQLVAAGSGEALDTLLGEARGAQRIVLSWNPAALKELLTRHAHRAEVVGTPPHDDAGQPLPAVGPAAFSVTTPARREGVLREALDTLDPKTPFVWKGGPMAPPGDPAPDAVLCMRLPTREEFAALSRIARPVLFPAAGQLGYLRSIAAPLTPLRLSVTPDRAEDRAAALRARIAERLETGSTEADLLLLQPLFDRFDPAEVAAALVGLLRSGPTPAANAAERLPAEWRKLFVKLGSKDGASAKDLVGALIRDVGLGKTEIGRIEVRDTFSVVEVAADAQDRALRGLNRVAIRGRRIEAREDREGEPTKRDRERARRRPQSSER